MKTIKYFLSAAIILLLISTGCSNKDSEFYNDIFVSVPNLVVINYDNVGNVLKVTADIPRLLNEPNQPNQLDIYKSTGGAGLLDFSYVIEKQIAANSWTIYEVPQSEITPLKGRAIASGPYIFGQSEYNATTSTYEFETELRLPPGNYRLSFGYNSTSTTDVEFRSESADNQLFLNLNSASSQLDAGGFFTFP